MPFTASGQETQWAYSYNHEAHTGFIGRAMSCHKLSGNWYP